MSNYILHLRINLAVSYSRINALKSCSKLAREQEVFILIPSFINISVEKKNNTMAMQKTKMHHNAEHCNVMYCNAGMGTGMAQW